MSPSVEIVPVPPESAPAMFPLVRTDWQGQQRCPGQGSRAAFHALAVTAADVLARDRARGQPPLRAGLTPQQEAALLAGV